MLTPPPDSTIRSHMAVDWLTKIKDPSVVKFHIPPDWKVTFPGSVIDTLDGTCCTVLKVQLSEQKRSQTSDAGGVQLSPGAAAASSQESITTAPIRFEVMKGLPVVVFPAINLYCGRI